MARAGRRGGAHAATRRRRAELGLAPGRPPRALTGLLAVTIATPAGALALLGSTASATSAPVATAAPVAPPTLRTPPPQRADRALRLPAVDPVPRSKAEAPPPAIPGCDPDGADDGGYRNGRLPDSALCDLPGEPGHALRADAAVAFVALRAAYEDALGEDLCLTDSYRSYAGQVALRAKKPRLAAVPGTSEHGWGLAVDLACGVERFGTREHRWLQDNAAAYGWVQPSWARRGGGKPEPWHWEYRD